MLKRFLQYLLASIRLCIFAIAVLITIPIHQLYTICTGDFIRVAKLFHAFCLKIFGIKVNVIGVPPDTKQPVVFLSNHLSHMDILVLGSFLDTVFISKDDVANWPLFGLLAKLQKTVFISRSRSGLANARTMIAQRLSSGQNLVLFPEGTSTRGETVFPFKSSLLSVFEEADPKPLIQPIAIKNTHLNKCPVTTNAQRDVYAWHIEDDLEIHEHIWKMAQQSSITIDVHLLAPVKIEEFNDRKDLSAYIQEKIRKTVEAQQPS